MAISIKFTKFDNTPWGFRLAGGSDFPQPLTVIRVTEGSLAEYMGLKVGDVVVRLNDQPISSLTHGQAHEELMRAGNNFVLGVLRQEDFVKAAEALSEENIVPYKIPLADLPPVFPEQILKEETVIERHEYEIKTCEEEEGSKQEVEPLPEKPKDANSEIVPNQNLTDDEIAQLILEEEELLDDKGVLGVNFKKLRPRVTVLKQSKVIEELQNIATAEPPLVEQLRRTSVFLQKPERPIPTPRKKEGEQEKETESYKVVIKKQKRRSVTDRLLERGLLKPEGGSTPEPFTPEVNMETKTEGAEKIEEEEEEEEDSSILDASTCLALDDDPRVSGRSVQGIPRSILENRHDRPSLSFERETRAYETDGATAKGYREEKVARTRGEGKGRRKVSKRGSRTSARVRFPRCLSFAKWRHVGRAVEAKGGKSRLGRGIEVSRVPTSRRIAKKCSKRRRIGGRHLETYLKREDNWTTRRMVDGTFGRRSEARGCFPPVESKGEISWRKSDRVEGTLVRGIELVVARLRPYLLSNQRYFDERSRERSLYFKGRYVRRIFRRDACSLNRIRDAALSLKRNLGSREIRSTRGGNSWRIETRGYWTWYLALFGRFSTRPTSRKKFVSRARYVERILKRQFESLGLIGNHARCQLLQLLRSAAGSSAVIPGFSSLNSRQSDASSLSSVREGSVLSNLIRSSKDYISAEIFHRGSRRSSSRSRSRASSGVSSNLFHGFRTFLRVDRSLPDKRFGEGRGRMSSDKEKMAEDNDRDGRRLSFVPTILYESLTNRIGVDFTRFVAYAFVPCTSLILLYMYK